MRANPFTKNLTAFALSPILLAAALFASVSVSDANEYVSNIFGNDPPTYQLVDHITTSGHSLGYNLANAFTTGYNAVSLDSITVSLAGGFGSGLTTSLYSNASGSVGSLLITLNGDTAPDAGGLIIYTPSSFFSLAANTTYWAVFSVPQTSPDKQFPVYTTGSAGQIGDPGWSIADSYAYQAVTDGTSGAWVNSSTKTPLQFAVNAVPEPSTVALLIGGVGALSLFMRRRSGTAK